MFGITSETFGIKRTETCRGSLLDALRHKKDVRRILRDNTLDDDSKAYSLFVLWYDYGILDAKAAFDHMAAVSNELKEKYSNGRGAPNPNPRPGEHHNYKLSYVEYTYTLRRLYGDDAQFEEDEAKFRAMIEELF